jgi:hypothetical protein
MAQSGIIQGRRQNGRWSATGGVGFIGFVGFIGAGALGLGTGAVSRAIPFLSINGTGVDRRREGREPGRDRPGVAGTPTTTGDAGRLARATPI